MRSRILFLVVAVLALFGMTAATPTQASPNSVSASDLRTLLNNLLEEHVYLAGTATGAALRADDAGFKAAAATLDQNTVELGKAVNAAYGADAEKAFLNLWRAHIGMFVDYTQGAAANDSAKKQKAMTDLDGYRRDFDAFLSGANPNLPKGAVAQLLTPHVQLLEKAIDGQAAKDTNAAFDNLHQAAHQSQQIADPLGAAIAKQMPDKFDGASDSGWATLRANLNYLLQEHVYLAGTATGAALRADDAGFKSAAATLDQNTVELGKAVNSVYGADGEKAFLNLWRAHIGMFVDYTQGAAANDNNKKQKAQSDLDGYRRDFDAFISGANPKIPKGAVAQLLTPHVQLLEKAIDGQAAKDNNAAFDNLHKAAHQTQDIADPLALGIGTQFPDKFGAGTPTNTPTTGADFSNNSNGLFVMFAIGIALLSTAFVVRARTVR